MILGSPQIFSSFKPLARIRNRSQTIPLQAGTLIVLSRSQDLRKSQKRSTNLCQLPADAADHELLEIFTSTITFIPNVHGSRAKLLARVCQESTTKGFSFIHPTLSFCSMIAEDSVIFKVIANGDTEELIRMFENNLAAITDCDPRGRSLLNVGIPSRKGIQS
jgi:hypothetical protein